jgi:molybdopterin molybdotransferase
MGGPGARAPVELSYAAARARVLAAARPLAPLRVPLAAARGRALREPVAAPHDLPAFTNSSMDGYAVRSADLAGATEANPIELPVGLVLPAGRVADRPLAAGEAMRIMTGAAVPAGADAVVPFEDCERIGDRSAGGGSGGGSAGGDDGERVRFRRPVAPGTSLRTAGADLAAGAQALAGGREISPHDLALLAALGVPEVAVGPAPAVAIVSTGDELIGTGEPLRPGAVRDSNVPMLVALIEEAGGRPLPPVRVSDDPAAVVAALKAALAGADVVLSIGGVSAGDFDPVKQGLGAIGGIDLWRVAMKPGRPQAFGAPGGRLYFGLPGNPASVACVFEALVRPALRALQGFAGLDRPAVEVRIERAMASRAGRTDFVRATLARRGAEWWAAEAGEQVSGHLTPQSRAHALVVVPEEATALAPGDRAEAWVLRWPAQGAIQPRPSQGWQGWHLHMPE